MPYWQDLARSVGNTAVEHFAQPPDKKLYTKGDDEDLTDHHPDFAGELHVKGGDNIAGEDDIDQQIRQPLPGGAGDDVFFAEKKSHHHNEKDADLQVQHGGEGAHSSRLFL